MYFFEWMFCQNICPGVGLLDHILVSVYKRETDQWHGEQSCGCQGGWGREWDGRGVWDWWIQTVKFGMDGQWAPTVQHRELCVIGSLCCTAEIEKTLQINHTLLKKKNTPKNVQRCLLSWSGEVRVLNCLSLKVVSWWPSVKDLVKMALYWMGTGSVPFVSHSICLSTNNSLRLS